MKKIFSTFAICVIVLLACDPIPVTPTDNSAKGALIHKVQHFDLSSPTPEIPRWTIYVDYTIDSIITRITDTRLGSYFNVKYPSKRKILFDSNNGDQDDLIIIRDGIKPKELIKFDWPLPFPITSDTLFCIYVNNTLNSVQRWDTTYFSFNGNNLSYINDIQIEYFTEIENEDIVNTTIFNNMLIVKYYSNFYLLFQSLDGNISLTGKKTNNLIKRIGNTKFTYDKDVQGRIIRMNILNNDIIGGYYTFEY